MAGRTPKPSNKLLASIAYSLDSPPELAPHFDRLFGQLASLGAMPRPSVALIAPFIGSGKATRVLDAGCGKGAIGVALAKRLGCRVFGFDAYPPFVEAARRATERAGVQPLCRFERNTAEAFFTRPHRFDAAVMLNLWPVGRASGALRGAVRPGGVYLIDDATLDVAHRDAHRFDGAPTPDGAARTIERMGDAVLRVYRPTPSLIARRNASLYRRIEVAANALAKEQPKLRSAVRDLLARQREANTLLTGPLRSTLWAVRRGK